MTASTKYLIIFNAIFNMETEPEIIEFILIQWSSILILRTVKIIWIQLSVLMARIVNVILTHWSLVLTTIINIILIHFSFLVNYLYCYAIIHTHRLQTVRNIDLNCLPTITILTYTVYYARTKHNTLIPSLSRKSSTWSYVSILISSCSS